MQVFDASSMIYAWDNYPISHFPSLWEWIGEQVTEGELQMPKVAINEVRQKTPDCSDWLKKNNLQRLDVSDEIVQSALRIKTLLQIQNDEYGKGVGENDIFIIATAKICSAELVSNEARQPKLPNEPRNRKIPAVCAMPEVSVVCINFLEYLKRTEAVFR